MSDSLSKDAVRLGISGTYSSGKTFTALAVSHYYGLPRTRARTMREILPEAAPGKSLEQCSAAQLVQMIVTRHVERSVQEAALGDSFVSDGSSLQEWIYGSIRVRVGINPNESAGRPDDEDVAKTTELVFFEKVMAALGVHFKSHVSKSFSTIVHLKNELDLSPDGHRPVNDRFRRLSDEALTRVTHEIGLPVHTVSGSVEDRLQQIGEVIKRKPILDLPTALERTRFDYESIDTTLEVRGVSQKPGLNRLDATSA